MKNGLSFGAIIGYVSGLIILISTILNVSEEASDIQKLYQIISFGIGFILIVLGTISQNAKNGNKIFNEMIRDQSILDGQDSGLLNSPDSQQIKKTYESQNIIKL